VPLRKFPILPPMIPGGYQNKKTKGDSFFSLNVIIRKFPMFLKIRPKTKTLENIRKSGDYT
jgi:hypothetical protein